MVLSRMAAERGLGLTTQSEVLEIIGEKTQLSFETVRSVVKDSVWQLGEWITNP